MIAILILTLTLINSLVIYDKVACDFKHTTIFINIFKLMFVLLRDMATIRGVISFLFVWLLLSGVGLSIVGFIIGNSTLKILGGIIFTFWLGPFTPLMPIVIGLSMLFQRYILRDKSVSFKKGKRL